MKLYFQDDICDRWRLSLVNDISIYNKKELISIREVPIELAEKWLNTLMKFEEIDQEISEYYRSKQGKF